MRFTFALALCAAVSIPAASFADITRGCAAIWKIKAGSIQKEFGRFEARGRCRGKAWANDCRRNARGYAQECFRESWNRRWEEDIRSGKYIPSTCLARGDIRVKNFRVRDLKRDIELNACSMPIARPFRVQVIGRTWGDKRCGGEIVLSSTYEIKDEMCGKL